MLEWSSTQIWSPDATWKQTEEKHIYHNSAKPFKTVKINVQSVNNNSFKCTFI